MSVRAPPAPWPKHLLWISGVVAALACNVRGSDVARADPKRAPAQTMQSTKDTTPPPRIAVAVEQDLAEPPAAAEPAQVTRMVVSDALAADFKAIERTTYEGEEIDALFTTLRAGSLPFCQHKHKLAEDDPEAGRAFLEAYDAYRKADLGTKLTIIAGCWNFIRMNDRQPHRPFELVGWLYPDKRHDCYTVGVVQAYLMQERLSCRSLTMIDFDWQVQYVHHQLLERWDAGELGQDKLDSSIAGMTVDWIAFHSPQAEHKVTMATFCHPGIDKLCRATFAALDERRADDKLSLERITLNLSGLHDMTLDDVTAEGVPVIYLSNATEKHFMTREEFDAMISRLEAALELGQHAAFVTHVAGKVDFAIYDLERLAEGSKLTTRCRDAHWGELKSNGEPYETWFEKVVKDGKETIPTCQSSWVRNRREQRKAAAEAAQAAE